MRSKIKVARERVEALRLALISPTTEEMGGVLPGLDDAVRCLAAIEQEIRRGALAPFEVRRELEILKNDLRISSSLIQHGVEFCRGWAKMIGAGPAYTQAGTPVASSPEGTLSLQG